MQFWHNILKKKKKKKKNSQTIKKAWVHPSIRLIGQETTF
jgi:hypothetical protein